MSAVPVSVRDATGPTVTVPRWWRGLSWRALVGAGGVAAFLVAAVLAGAVSPYSPDALAIGSRLEGPSAAHLLGTDQLGRDVLTRILYGLRPSLESGFAAIMMAAVVGVALGLPSGYFGSLVDTVVTRVLDLLVAWPAVFLALAIVLLLGTGELQVIVAIGLAEVPVFSRLVRSIAMVAARSDHVVAARAAGASSLRIMLRHVLPFVVTPLVVQFAIAAPQALVAEASLNYLGLGTHPPAPSLGAMVSEGQSFLAYAAGPIVFPILVIVALVVSLTLLADGLQDRLDPRSRIGAR
ncbi:MAG: ABC transporter permease [Actinomycetota bacterium]|nr:ABC transporter permease [Actinomycetota bacterium]